MYDPNCPLTLEQALSLQALGSTILYHPAWSKHVLSTSQHAWVLEEQHRLGVTVFYEFLPGLLLDNTLTD